MEKRYRLLTARRKLVGKAGGHLVGGTERESTMTWRQGIIEQFGSRSGNRSET